MIHVDTDVTHGIQVGQSFWLTPRCIFSSRNDDLNVFLDAERVYREAPPMALHVCWAFQIRILLTLLVFSGFIVDYFLVALHLLDLFLWTYKEEGLQCNICGN